MTAYVTLPQAKDWLGIELTNTKEDSKIVLAIDACSRAVDQHCKRSFAHPSTSATARVFEANYGNYVEIHDAESITTVETDDDRNGVFETTWAAGDWQPQPFNAPTLPEPEPFTEIRAVGSRRFPLSVTGGRLGLVRVTAVWGWPSVPASVKQATLLVMARIVKRKDSPEGVAGFDQWGVVRIDKRTDPDAAQMLIPYVKELAFA